MKMNFLFAGAAVLLLAACSSQNQNDVSANNTETAIYGGDEVQAADVIATTTVGLYNKTDKYICTGSLYGKNMVITAAHCLEGKASNLEVRFGVSMKTPSVTRKVIAGQRNSAYTGKIKPNMGDVALLKYEGTIPPGYNSVNILPNYSSLKSGAKIVAAGYGISSPSIGSGSGTLRKITLKVKDEDYSKTEISVSQGLFNGVCSGDSGGPAFLQTGGQIYLWGVTSNGAGIPILRPCMFFAVFTRVDSYLPWINDLAGRL